MTDKQIIIGDKTFIVLNIKSRYRRNPGHRVNTIETIKNKYKTISKVFNNDVIKANPDIFKDIYIFGGAVVDMLINFEFRDISDFDICILAKTHEEFMLKLNKLKESMNIVGYTSGNRFIITFHTMYDNGEYEKIEIATKLIGSIKELFTFIDIPATACTYNLLTGDIFMSEECLASLTTKRIYIDLSKCNWSYEYRLHKYFVKGFDILLDSSLIPNYTGDILYHIKTNVKYGLSSLIYEKFRNIGYDNLKIDTCNIDLSKLVIDKNCADLHKISVDGMTYGQKTDWLTIKIDLDQKSDQEPDKSTDWDDLIVEEKNITI